MKKKVNRKDEGHADGMTQSASLGHFYLFARITVQHFQLNFQDMKSHLFLIIYNEKKVFCIILIERFGFTENIH